MRQFWFDNQHRMSHALFWQGKFEWNLQNAFYMSQCCSAEVTLFKSQSRQAVSVQRNLLKMTWLETHVISFPAKEKITLSTSPFSGIFFAREQNGSVIQATVPQNPQTSNMSNPLKVWSSSGISLSLSVGTNFHTSLQHQQISSENKQHPEMKLSFTKTCAWCHVYCAFISLRYFHTDHHSGGLGNRRNYSCVWIVLTEKVSGQPALLSFLQRLKNKSHVTTTWFRFLGRENGEGGITRTPYPWRTPES